MSVLLSSRYATEAASSSTSQMTSASLLTSNRIPPMMSMRSFHTTAAISKDDDPDKAVVTWSQKIKNVPWSQKIKNVPGMVRRAPGVVWKELVHLYHGFRLLGIDIKIASKLMYQLLKTGKLSRRESRQLVRTVADIFRLVPFLVFVLVPFLELLLPVALKLFPNMLPSTFESEDKKREKQLKTLKAKVEMAKFLQSTLKGSIEDPAEDEEEQAKRVDDFIQFLANAQTSGKPVRNEDIMKYSALFENEITLDNLRRPQITALCQLLELQPMGTNNFLRFQIRMQLRSLKADDRLIRKEGVEALAVWELQQANRARGMRSLGLTETQLQNQLKQWINLHLDHKIPATLLLLSRIIYIGDGQSIEAQLAGTMTKLSEQSTPLTKTIVEKEKKKKIVEPLVTPVAPEVIQDVIAPAATTIVTPKRFQEQTPLTEPMDALGKIMLLKLEEEKIKFEKEELAKKERELKAKEEKFRELKEMLKDVAPSETIEADMKDTAPHLDTGVAAPDKAPGAVAATTATAQTGAAAPTCPSPSTEDVTKRRSRFLELNEQLDSIKSLADQLKVEGKEGKDKLRLDRRVKRMITSMDKIVDKLHKDRQKHAQAMDEKVKEIEAAAFKELDAESQKTVQEAMAAAKQRVVTVDELVDAVARIQKVPDKERVAKIVELLDEDRDGSINQEDVLRVLDLIGRENVKLSDKRMDEILSMVQRESLLEEVEKAEAQLESAAKVVRDVKESLDTKGLIDHKKNRNDNNDIDNELGQKKQRNA